MSSTLILLITLSCLLIGCYSLGGVDINTAISSPSVVINNNNHYHRHYKSSSLRRALQSNINNNDDNDWIDNNEVPLLIYFENANDPPMFTTAPTEVAEEEEEEEVTTVTTDEEEEEQDESVYSYRQMLQLSTSQEFTNDELISYQLLMEGYANRLINGYNNNNVDGGGVPLLPMGRNT